MYRESSAGSLPSSQLIRTPDQRVRVFVSSIIDEFTKERVAARSWNILGIYWDAFWGIVIVAFTVEFLWKPYYRS